MKNPKHRLQADIKEDNVGNGGWEGDGHSLEEAQNCPVGVADGKRHLQAKQTQCPSPSLLSATGVAGHAPAQDR